MPSDRCGYGVVGDYGCGYKATGADDMDSSYGGPLQYGSHRSEQNGAYYSPKWAKTPLGTIFGVAESDVSRTHSRIVPICIRRECLYISWIAGNETDSKNKRERS